VWPLTGDGTSTPIVDRPDAAVEVAGARFHATFAVRARNVGNAGAKPIVKVEVGMQSLGSDAVVPMLQITPTERATLQLLANGQNDSEIAARLRVTVPEVDATLVALFARMGVAGRAQAVAVALRRGLVDAN
jgi:DNA-binding CsgD family transcriptional regulator